MYKQIYVHTYSHVYFHIYIYTHTYAPSVLVMDSSDFNHHQKCFMEYLSTSLILLIHLKYINKK